MSVPAKVTFTLSCVVTLGIVGYVHIKQVIDRERLHEGVLKDIERQKQKAENILMGKKKDVTDKYLAQER